jgi:hypothetical protein
MSRTWATSIDSLKPRPSADEHRHVGDVELESIEQALNPFVAIEVDVPVGIAVTREELPDAKRAGRVIGSDEHDIAEFVRDQRQAAKDERAHEDLAQLGVRLHEQEQLIAHQVEHLAVLGHTNADEARPPGEHVRLAGELAGCVDRDDRLDLVGGPDDLDAAGDDHEEVDVRHAGFHQHLAARDRPAPAMRGDPGDLRGGERRKSDVVSRVRCGRRVGRGGDGGHAGLLGWRSIASYLIRVDTGS